MCNAQTKKYKLFIWVQPKIVDAILFSNSEVQLCDSIRVGTVSASGVFRGAIGPWSPFGLTFRFFRMKPVAPLHGNMVN